jgi:membrane protein required for colicin V production
MIIDIIAIVLLVMAIFKGLRNGLVVAVFSLLAFIIGLTAAIKLSVVVADYLGENVNISQRWLPVVAFALVFIGVVFLVKLGAKAIEGVLRMALLGWLNKIGGVVLYIVLYLFIFSVLLFYAEQLQIIKPQTIEASATYNSIKPIGPAIMNAMGSVIPFFKDMFSGLEDFFDELGKRKA